MKTPDRLTETKLTQLDSMRAQVSPELLRGKIENGEIFTLIEVSHPDSFRDGHINGAVLAELPSVTETVAQIASHLQQIVVYTAENDSSAAHLAAASLQRAGWSNVIVLLGGKQAWRNKGYLLVD